jgi:hypothetical protein
VSYDDPDEDEDDAPMITSRNSAVIHDPHDSDSGNSVGALNVDCPPITDVQRAQLTRRTIMETLGQTYLQDMVCVAARILRARHPLRRRGR